MGYYCVIAVLVAMMAVCTATECDFVDECVTDLTDDDCPSNQVLLPNSFIFDCCPRCGIPTDDGGNGDENFLPGCRPPANCLPDRKYAPVQCKGDVFTGRCFCSDEHGKRIFGQMWRNEATDMTCACSRRRAELEAAGKISTLHCTSTGDYEPLQCDDGLCWCAEPSTGQPTATPVPETDMTRLPCYDAGTTGTQYLRKCESLVLAMATISAEQSAHGTNFLGNPTAFCDYDGSYGPYQITNGIAYCTGNDGEILGSWQAVSSEMSGMNCHCARDTAVYFPAKGMAVTEVCLANGNYRPNQNVGDVYYCVDSDGYPATDMMDEWPADDCRSFA